MAALYMPVGTELFRKLRENGYWYCDKTAFLASFLRYHADVTLFTRPRRFGKTLTMSAMAEFLDIEKDSRDIFTGLNIMQDTTLCDVWMNRRPVLFLSLKDVEGATFGAALHMLADVLSCWCEDHPYLLASTHLSEEQRIFYKKLRSKDIAQQDLVFALKHLSRMMHAHYGVRPVLLLDEYDVPLARAEINGFYGDMADFMRGFLGGALKTNPDFEFAILTGCLRIAKESVFTGLNNFECFTITHGEYADVFGFTPQEVDALLAETGLTDKAGIMRQWYDGYRFGNGTEIFCPWDVIRYVKALLFNSNARPENYWANSSGNDIVKKLISRNDLASTRPGLEKLLAGGCLPVQLNENLTYDALYGSEENIWNVLFQTGYLTRADEATRERCACSEDDHTACLVIPNREVLDIFTENIRTWFLESLHNTDRTDLVRALWNGDTATLSTMMSATLAHTISYHDAKEDYYHAFLAGVLSFGQIEVRSNREYGNGRPDIVALESRCDRAAIIEVKRAASAQALEAAAREALKQIAEKNYADGLDCDPAHVIKYGVAFYRKKCLFLKA